MGRAGIRLALRRILLPTAALRSSAQLLIGRAFTQLGIFVAAVLVARAEGPQSYGLYSAAFAMTSLTVGGATAGLPILLLRRASEGDVDHGILWRAVRLQLGFSLVAVVITALLGLVILGGVPGVLTGISAASFFVANNLATLGQYVHAGRRQYLRAAGTDVVAGTLFPILTYVALAAGMGVNGSLLALALSCGVSCSVAWTGLPEMKPHRRPSPLKAFDGASFTALGLATAGYGRADTVTLALVDGTLAAGYYSAAYRLLGPFHLMGSAVVTVYFSRLSEYSKDKHRWSRVRREGTILFFVTAVAAMAVLFVAAPLVVRFFYGPEYERSVTLARVLLLSIVPWSLYWLKSADLASVRLETRATAVLASGFLLNMLLVAAFGSQFGATGAAWAWVCSEGAMLIVMTLVSRGAVERVGVAAPEEDLSEVRGQPGRLARPDNSAP